MATRAKRHATYDDLLQVAPERVAEIVDGQRRRKLTVIVMITGTGTPPSRVGV